MSERPGLTRDCQEILAAEDARLFWEYLYRLVASITDSPCDLEAKTQELFLEIMLWKEFVHHREAGLTEEEINKELLAKLNEL